jgi:hypothetical protein
MRTAKHQATNESSLRYRTARYTFQRKTAHESPVKMASSEVPASSTNMLPIYGNLGGMEKPEKLPIQARWGVCKDQ